MVTVPSVSGPTATPERSRLPDPVGLRQSAEGASGAAFGSQLAGAEGQFSDAVARMGMQAAQAAVQMQEQKNAREIMKQYNAYQSATATLYRQYKETMDLTDDEVGAAFNAELQALREAAIAENKGGPIAAGQLDKLLSEAQSGISMKMVGDMHDAINAEDARVQDEEGNRLYETTFKNPFLLENAIEHANTLAAVAGQGKSPQARLEIQKAYHSKALSGALNGMLSAGNWREVSQILRENPDAAHILGPEEFEKVLWKMNTIASGVDSAKVNLTLDQRTENSLFETLGKSLGEIGKKVMEDALSAGQIKSSIATQRGLLESGAVKPGAATGPRETIAKWAELFGIKNPQLAKALQLGDPAASDLFNAEHAKQVAEWAEQGSRLTNMLLVTVDTVAPQLAYTEQGNRVIMMVREAQLDAIIREAEIFENAIVHQDKARLNEERNQLREDLKAERDELQMLVDRELATPGRPQNADEARARFAEGAQATPGSTTDEGAEQPTELTPEQKIELDNYITTNIPGWSFHEVTGDGRLVIINEKGKKQKSDVPFMQLLEGLQQQEGEGAPDETGGEAPTDESSKQTPFTDPRQKRS